MGSNLCESTFLILMGMGDGGESGRDNEITSAVVTKTARILDFYSRFQVHNGSLEDFLKLISCKFISRTKTRGSAST